MRDLAFVVGLLCMLTFIFGRPHIGVLLWAWTALLIPNSFFYGFAVSFPFNLIVAVSTLFAWLISKEPVRIRGNSTVFLLIVLAILGTASAYLTIGSAQVAWREWDKFIKIIFFALVIGGLIKTRARFEALVYAIVLSLGFLGVLEAMKFLASGGGHSIRGPGSSILADNNHFALAMICTIPLVFFLYHQTSSRILRIGLAGTGALLFFAVVGTFSRGGLIGLSAVVLWAFFHSTRKAKLFVVAIPLVLALMAFAPDRWFNRMDTLSTASEDSSFMGRVIAWKISTLIALDNPILGGGFHSVQNPAVMAEYRITKFHKLDFIPTGEPEHARAAHSIYFQVIGDLGFLGLVVFLALGITAWRNSLFIVKKATGRTDLEWARQLALSLQYSLVGYFVAGAALSMAYFELIYILFALLAALRGVVERSAAARQPIQIVAKEPAFEGAELRSG